MSLRWMGLGDFGFDTDLTMQDLQRDQHHGAKGDGEPSHAHDEMTGAGGTTTASPSTTDNDDGCVAPTTPRSSPSRRAGDDGIHAGYAFDASTLVGNPTQPQTEQLEVSPDSVAALLASPKRSGRSPTANGISSAHGISSGSSALPSSTLPSIGMAPQAASHHVTPLTNGWNFSSLFEFEPDLLPPSPDNADFGIASASAARDPLSQASTYREYAITTESSSLPSLERSAGPTPSQTLRFTNHSHNNSSSSSSSSRRGTVTPSAWASIPNSLLRSWLLSSTFFNQVRDMPQSVQLPQTDALSSGTYYAAADISDNTTPESSLAAFATPQSHPRVDYEELQGVFSHQSSAAGPTTSQTSLNLPPASSQLHAAMAARHGNSVEPFRTTVEQQQQQQQHHHHHHHHLEHHTLSETFSPDDRNVGYGVNDNTIGPWGVKPSGSADADGAASASDAPPAKRAKMAPQVAEKDSHAASPAKMGAKPGAAKPKNKTKGKKSAKGSDQDTADKRSKPRSCVRSLLAKYDHARLAKVAKELADKGHGSFLVRDDWIQLLENALAGHAEAWTDISPVHSSNCPKKQRDRLNQERARQRTTFCIVIFCYLAELYFPSTDNGQQDQGSNATESSD